MGEAGILRSPKRHNHTVFANKHRKAEPRSILGGASSIVCSNLNTHVPVYLSWFLRTLGCQWTYRLRRQFNGLCGVSTHMCAWATILSYVAAILFDFREPDMREDGTWASLHMRAYNIRDLGIRHTQTGGLKHRGPHVL
ncbi:hypothetical protein HZ326_3085 [Fusarium oxysporum f. sp. albedinis]|nr:hypothetical protein HZ326_3085 [Fusarium oxysporum f. sp. albedinis]